MIRPTDETQNSDIAEACGAYFAETRPRTRPPERAEPREPLDQMFAYYTA